MVVKEHLAGGEERHPVVAGQERVDSL